MLSSYKTKLIFKQYLTRDVCLFRFQLQEPSELHFVSGQYMILVIPQNKDNLLRRLYSIASSEKQINSFELLIKLVEGGIGSSYLANLKIGDFVDFQGPAGQFGLKENNKNKIFLVTGTGIVPMLSMINKLVNSKSKVLNPKQTLNFNDENLKQKNMSKTFLFWGLATFQDVFYLDELKQIKKENPEFDFKICLSREKDLSMIKYEDQQFFSLGHINDKLKMLHVTCYTLHDSEFYLCGRREMVEGLRIELEELGVGKEKIYFERF